MNRPKETRPGNYFVANYPPFGFWRPEALPAARAALEQPPPPGQRVGLYVHIPFCRKRCHFCYFKVYTEQNAAQVQRYLEAVVREAHLYAGRPFLGGRALDFVYFGGGTPSYLSARQLGELTAQLQALWPWTAAEEVTFECEPGTLSEPKLEAIRAMGVTRLSLGVENFDDAILERNGRAHRSGEIDRAYRWARAIGFEQINVDLIAGMVGETDANWQRCVEQTLALAPDSVTVYQMEIPFNTVLYRQMQGRDGPAEPLADWETKRRWVDEAFGQLEGAGYTVVSAYTAVREPVRTKFVYRDRLWQGADLIPLGVASFGHIGGVHFQNEHDLGPYLERVERGQWPWWRGFVPTAQERLTRELVLQLKLGRVSRRYFQDKFAVDVAEVFAGPLETLSAAGWLTVDAEAIVLTRAGLLQVDGWLPEFFQERYRGC
jgi:oxygen-independent coproporphyrinogen-3 oxidase